MKFLHFDISYLFPHGYSLDGFAMGKSLLSSRIAINVAPPNDRQKYSRAKVRSIPERKARINLRPGAPLFFSGRKIR
jgi:hypothetical protein